MENLEKYFEDYIKKHNIKYYEVVEDSYEYENGLLLIIYKDEKHEVEDYHICIDLDNIKRSEVMIKNEDLQFGKQLLDILDIYTDKEWTDEPLDGDEVDKLTEHIKNQLNLINGNITEQEYKDLEK